MDTHLWRTVFGSVAKAHGFEKIGKSWGIRNGDSVVVLDLQKSKHGDKLYLNLNVFLQGFEEQVVDISNDLVGKVGHIFRRQSPAWNGLFESSAAGNPDAFRGHLERFFGTFIVPFVTAMRTRESIWKFAKERPDEIFLTPAVRRFLVERQVHKL